MAKKGNAMAEKSSGRDGKDLLCTAMAKSGDDRLWKSIDPQRKSKVQPGFGKALIRKGWAVRSIGEALISSGWAV